MKIALDTRDLRGYSGGGVSLYISKIINYLVNETEASILLFCRRDFSSGDLKLDDKFSSRITLLNLDTEGPGASLNNYNIDTKVIPNLLKEHNIDIYHACFNWGISSQNISIPTLLTVHDIIPFSIREGPVLEDDKFNWYKKSITSSINNATKIVTVSYYSKKAIIEKFNISEDKIDVIYNGLDAEANQENCRKKGVQLLADKRLSRDNYFIYIGGFYERKNTIRLVKAFKKLLKDHPYYKLVVTGDSGAGKNNDYISNRFKLFEKEVSDIKKNVHFMGFISREELNMLIANARALIYPSIYEGFGLPILEAMILRTPALCSNNTVLPEIGEDAALYFDPFDVESIYHSMLTIINDSKLRTEKINLGINRAKHFSWEKSCKTLYKLYEKLLAV